MKLNKIFTILFLLVFGYISASLRREIILKSDVSDLNSNFLNFMLNVDFSVGFLYPIFFFTFFFIIFTASSFLIVDKKISNLSEIIIYSMFPNFIFTLINYYYATEMSIDLLKEINQNQSSAIIPFLSFSYSTLISNLLYIFPSLYLFLFLLFKKKYNLLNSFLISIFPLLIVLITYIFI